MLYFLLTQYKTFVILIIVVRGDTVKILESITFYDIADFALEKASKNLGMDVSELSDKVRDYEFRLVNNANGDIDIDSEFVRVLLDLEIY